LGGIVVAVFLPITLVLFLLGRGRVQLELLCVYLFLTDKESLIKFILMSLSINNLLDEMFFDNTKLELNEILTALTIFIFAIIKKKKC
jgi:hypothetical protein